MVTRHDRRCPSFQVLRLRKLAMAQLTETELDSLGKKHPMNLSHEDMAFSKNPCVSGMVSDRCENLRPTEDLKLSTTQVKAHSSNCCIHFMQFSVVIMRHWMSLDVIGDGFQNPQMYMMYLLVNVIFEAPGWRWLGSDGKTMERSIQSPGGIPNPGARWDSQPPTGENIPSPISKGIWDGIICPAARDDHPPQKEFKHVQTCLNHVISISIYIYIYIYMYIRVLVWHRIYATSHDQVLARSGCDVTPPQCIWKLLKSHHQKLGDCGDLYNVGLTTKVKIDRTWSKQGQNLWCRAHISREAVRDLDTHTFYSIQSHSSARLGLCCGALTDTYDKPFGAVNLWPCNWHALNELPKFLAHDS